MTEFDRIAISASLDNLKKALNNIQIMDDKRLCESLELTIKTAILTITNKSLDVEREIN